MKIIERIYIEEKKDIRKKAKNYDYKITSNCFDPSKQSPPNEFLLKLMGRINSYIDIKKDNLDKK